MYIPNSIPTTLAAMQEFLQPMVADGFFDEVSISHDETTLNCWQGGVIILVMNITNGSWTFTPIVDTGTPATGSHVYSEHALEFVCRCSGGAYFRSVSQSSLKYEFVIGKTNAGITGFIQVQVTNSYNPSNGSLNLYTSTNFDKTNLLIYSNGYRITTNYGGADRTILSNIPVAGQLGSTDYLTTVFVRNVVQFTDTGEQLIDGVKYYCVWHFAIIDE